MADVDPGNFATNFQGGVQFGHLLLWVVLAANVIAMLIQYLSAKLGIAPDRNLAENFRAHYPHVLTLGHVGAGRSWRCPPTSPSSSAARSA